MQVNSIGVSDYNKQSSFKGLVSSPKEIIAKKVGKPLADAFEHVKPQLEEMATDVDMIIMPHRNHWLDYNSLKIYTRSLNFPHGDGVYKLEFAGTAIPWHNNKEFLSKTILKQAEKCKKDFLAMHKD